jgi:TPR repeat protein
MKTRQFLIVVMLLFMSSTSSCVAESSDNPAVSVARLKERAAQGVARAQFNLGVMYTKGEGVPQDSTEALKWYRLAAAQGDADAQFNLGVMCYYGHGIPQDYVQSHKWFNPAAANSTAEPDRDKAVEARDALATLMTPAQIAEARKLAREWKKR